MGRPDASGQSILVSSAGQLTRRAFMTVLYVASATARAARLGATTLPTCTPGLNGSRRREMCHGRVCIRLEKTMPPMNPASDTRE